MNEEQLKLLKTMLELYIDVEEDRKGWHNISIAVSIADELGIELEN